MRHTPPLYFSVIQANYFLTRAHESGDRSHLVAISFPDNADLEFALLSQSICINVRMHPKGTTLARRMNARESHGQQTIELLAKQVTSEAIAQAVASALQAETVTREGTVPDYRTRLEACKIYLNYLVGLPVQRQEIVHQAVRTEQESLDAILASPAALAALEARISEAKRRQDVARLVVVNP